VSELTFRRYAPTDKNAVWSVHERAFRAAPVEHYPELNRKLRHVSRTFLDDGGDFLVGTLEVPPADPGEYGPDDERITAMGGYLPSTADVATVRPSSPVEADERTIEVKSVRVDPAFQRRGFARALVSELESRARAAGFERAVLDTGADMVAAQSLYESLGYDRAGEESYRQFELVYFEKEL
jgi:ribosomal protein S18 acetylase RimI-like enzyme